MLDAHPQLAIPPETHFVARLEGLCASGVLEAIVTADRWSSFGLDADTLRIQAQERERDSPSDVVRLFYEIYAASQGKTRWGDKTPWYVQKMPMISALLEEAHFVHIIRDGRDVALSVIPLWFGPSSVPDAARWWVDRVRRGRRDGARLQYLEVRYEQLVEQPETELRRVCGFIGLDFDAQMLSFDTRVREDPARVAPHLVNLQLATESDEPAIVSPQEMQVRLAQRLSGPPDAASVGRWRTEMTAAESASFDEIAGDLLDELGYGRA